MKDGEHVPVMVEEVLEGLALKPGMTVVDGTVGLGGHSAAISQRIAPGGALYCFDWDEAMLERAMDRLSNIDGINLTPCRADYRAIPEWVKVKVDGVLLDLGLNLAQIADSERGISFSNDGPLDMRMDRSRGQTVAHFLSIATANEIERVLREFGDERWARRIAEVIVDRRKSSKIERTGELVDCVLAAIPTAMRDKRIHPATRTFQALRIHVNNELEGLEDAITDVARCLNTGGRMAVLSYHSGEDRAVKKAFRSLTDQEDFSLINKKPLIPSEREQQVNRRSRSAKLRIIERTPRKVKKYGHSTLD